MQPLIITVAGVGAELTKKATPYLPTNPDEIVADAEHVFKSGVQIYHLHVRDRQGKPTLKPEVVRQVVRGIRKKTDLIIQISTGGSIKDSYLSRQKVLDCKVDMASLTMGSINFGNDIFSNPIPFIKKMAQKMLQKKIKPELEIFDVSHVEQADKLLKEGLLVSPLHFNIILGGPGWLNATEKNLEFILNKLPKGSTWSASGVGKNQLTMIEYAIAHGGHVRTGLEDNIYIKKGKLAIGNGELVEQALILAKKYDRAIASVAEAKAILGLK